MLKTANGIEHASNHLMTNFERFLHLSTIVSRFEPDERKQVVGAIRRVMVSSEKASYV
jgi:hypothetical protein